MSTEMQAVEDRNGEVSLTQFYGGAHAGACLQVTGHKLYVSLTKDQAKDLAVALMRWVNGELPEFEYTEKEV